MRIRASRIVSGSSYGDRSVEQTVVRPVPPHRRPDRWSAWIRSCGFFNFEWNFITKSHKMKKFSSLTNEPFSASFYLLLSFQYSWYTVNKWSMTGFETQSFGFGNNHCTNWATTTAKNWKKVWNRAFTSLTSRRNRLLSVHSWWTDRCIQAMLLHVGVCRAREHSLTL